MNKETGRGPVSFCLSGASRKGWGGKPSRALEVESLGVVGMGWLKSIPWSAWGRQVLRYLMVVSLLELTDGLFGGPSMGLIGHVFCAFVALDGRAVWRQLTGQQGLGGGGGDA